MPELPEVESIRQSLLPLLTGQKILEVIEYRDDCLLNPEGLELEGLRIKTLDRKGKYLIVSFVLSPVQMLIHLRMTGKLLYQKSLNEPQKHTHVRLIFKDESSSQRFALDYNDVRRFGGLVLFSDPQTIPFPGFLKLGPDALDPAFSKSHLVNSARRFPGRSIKGLLLDQAVVAGLGNIYVDEALFQAGIHPKRKAGRIATKRLYALHAVIPPLLRLSIGLKGTSFSDYVDGLGKPGAFRNELQVYGRKGELCRICRRPLKCGVVAGRTTVYCPHCQR